MLVTNSGRHVEEYPLFRLRDGEGRFLLLLDRIDVSDVGNEPVAEAFYAPLMVFHREDQMTTVELRFGKKVFIIFISPKRIDWYVIKPDQETEQ
jgi:hypothetical protein